MVTLHGAEVDLRPRERAVLAALALRHPQSTSVETVITVLWPDGAPHTARTAVQNHISRVRGALGASAVETTVDGYRLDGRWSLDTERFDDQVRRARGELNVSGPTLARSLLDNALSLVRGEAFHDLPETAAVAAARARWLQLRLGAEESLVEALLDDGESTAISQASSLTALEPFREARWMLLALALYRDDQRRASLVALDGCRKALRDIAGLDAGPGVSRLESLILADDGVLRSAPARAFVRPDDHGDRGRDPTELELVGRNVAVATARRVMSAVVDGGQAQTLEIVGPPGVGKTELAQRIALLAELDGWTVLQATCHPIASRLFEPFGELVQQIIEPTVDDSDVGPGSSGLEALWTDEADRSPTGEIGTVAVEAIISCADRSPTLVVVDDTQHLPASSAVLMRQLGDAATQLMVVAVRRPTPDQLRPDDPDDPDGADDPTDAVGMRRTTLHLEGLDIDESSRMMELLLGAPVEPATMELIDSLTSGNPALLRQAAPSVSEASRAGRLDEATAVARILLAATELLSSAARRVADVLAVAGGPLAPVVVAATMNDVDDEVAFEPATVISECEASNVFKMTSDGRLDLADGALRAQLLPQLDDDAQSHLHERIGVALLSMTSNSLAAAPHLLRAAPRNPLLAIDVAGTAERVAHSATMFIEAASFAAAAADLAEREWGPNATATLELRLRGAENLRASGDPAYIDLLRSVIGRAEAARDERIFAKGVAAMCRLGPLTVVGGLDDELAQLIERALAGGIDPAVRAEVAGEATLFYSMSGRVDLCLSNFHDALAHARSADDDRVLLAALGNVYISLSHPDDWALRAELAEEFLALAERLDDDDARFQALHLYFSTQVMFGDPLLRTTFREQEALASSLRSAGRRWMAGYQRACLHYLDGRLDEADLVSGQNAETAPVGPSRAITAHFMVTLVVRLAQGREQELREPADTIIEQQPELPGWRAVAAWLAALRGDHDRVVREFDVLVGEPGLPRDMSWSGAMMLLGRAVASTGDRNRCTDMFERLAPYSGLMTWIGSCTVGPFDLALGELALAMGDREAARRYLDGAWRSARRLRAVVYEPDLERLGARVDSA